MLTARFTSPASVLTDAIVYEYHPKVNATLELIMTDMSEYIHLVNLITTAGFGIASFSMLVIVVTQFIVGVYRVGKRNFSVLSALVCTSKSTLIEFKQSLDKKLMQCHADVDGEDYNSEGDMDAEDNNQVR